MRSADGCIAREIIASYHAWLTFGGNPSDGMEQESSILYDTAAVHLAASDRFTRFEQWKLTVDDSGFLRPSENGMPVRVAMNWNDFGAYRRELLAKLAPSIESEKPQIENNGILQEGIREVSHEKQPFENSCMDLAHENKEYA